MIARDDNFVAVWLLTEPVIETGNLAQAVAVRHEIACVDQNIAIGQAHFSMLSVGVADTDDP